MYSTSFLEFYLNEMRDKLGLDDGQVIRLRQMIEAERRDFRSASDEVGRRAVVTRFNFENVPSILRADQRSAYETLQMSRIRSH